MPTEQEARETIDRLLMAAGGHLCDYKSADIHAAGGVDRKQIPGAQYDAVLIDKGHDFRPEWLKLVVQMVDPRTNSLLVLYDDAQSIYDSGKKVNFSFKSVGIQAQGRTTILKVNYRNTREILDFAAALASEHLRPADADEDGIPRIAPVSAGRHGPMPSVKQLPSAEAEASYIAEKLREARGEGTPWKDMAVLYRQYNPVGKIVREALVAAKIPLTWKDDIRFGKSQDTVKLLPFHSSKGLEFPVVAIPTGELMPSKKPLPPDEARLLYVAMTRATRLLIVSEVRRAR